MARLIKAAYVLVDWHNVQNLLVPGFAKAPRKHLPDLVLRIQNEVARILAQDAMKYRATLRVYHGWHSERTATPLRRDFESFSTDTSFARRIGRVSFAPGFVFGNELACATESHPLYATFRAGSDGGQKMVDTSIVSDLLHLHRLGLADVCIIASDDDDYVPALLTAKAWAAKTILLRKAGRDVSHVTDVDCRREISFWS